MCFSAGKLARPQWEGGFGFFGGLAQGRGAGVELGWEWGGGATSDGEAGVALI